MGKCNPKRESVVRKPATARNIRFLMDGSRNENREIN